MTKKEKNLVYELINDSSAKSSKKYHPSTNWAKVGKKQITQLHNSGYENFKRTIGRDYFQHMVSSLRYPYLWQLLSKISNRELIDIFFNSHIKGCPLPFFRSVIYKWYVSMLYLFVKKKDRHNILGLVNEPLEGNPIRVIYKGKLLSQDILNSTLEFYTMDSRLDLVKSDNLVVAEIGAGYGRLAYVIMSILKSRNLKYCIFDIPPALWISQRYLSNQFKNLKVMKFRNFKSFSEIEREFNESQICFFLPHQLETIPERKFDILISIATFPEMRRDQIDVYFDIIKRVRPRYFYSKQYWEHYNPNDDYSFNFEEYPIPKEWDILLLRPAPYMKDFAEVIYSIR